MRGRITALAIVLLLIASGLTVLASSGWTPQGISETQTPFKAHILDATPDHYWIGTTTDTSVAANWQPAAVPATGDNIYFSALSAGNCAWGLTGSYGSFNLLANFSRTVTQGASFSVTSYAQAAGTFTGSVSYTLTDSGDFIKTSGTITSHVLRVTMTGDGKAFSPSASITLYGLEVSANITCNTISITGTATSYLTVDAGKTLTINGGNIVSVRMYSGGATFTNNGIIAGPGGMTFPLNDADRTISFGTINAPTIVNNGGGAAPRTLTLSSSAVFGSTLTVTPTSGQTITLDLSSSNYALSAAGITIDALATINARSSAITCSGWDSSAGTFTQDTSSVRLTGTSGTLKTTGTSTFNKLFLDVGSSYTLQSNVITQQYWKNGTLALGGHTLYVDQDQAPSVTSTPASTSFACNQQYAYTYSGSDREGENLTYGLTTNLSGLTLSAGNSTIWRHGAQHARGTFTMHLSVTEGNHTLWQNTTLTVTNLVPYFTSTPIVSKSFDLDYSYDANATDPESFTITYGLSSSLGGLTVNSTTGIVSKAHYLGNGTYLVNVSASDGNYTVWQSYTLTILNLVPVVTSSPSMYSVIHESYLYVPAGTDPEGLPLTINVTTNAPWLIISPNGTISGSPLRRDVGHFNVNITYWDGYRTTQENYVIEVTGIDSTLQTILSTLLALVFGFGLIGLSLVDRKRPIWPTFTGFVWLVLSVTIFYVIDPMYFIMGTGVGLILMLEGSMAYAAHRKQGAG